MTHYSDVMSEDISDKAANEIQAHTLALLAACRSAAAGTPEEHLSKETVSLAVQALLDEADTPAEFIEAAMKQIGIQIAWRTGGLPHDYGIQATKWLAEGVAAGLGAGIGAPAQGGRQ